MPLTIYVPDILVKAETNDDYNQTQSSDENLHKRIETSNDKNHDSYEYSLCSRSGEIFSSSAEENATKPTTTAKNSNLDSRSIHERKWDEIFEALCQYKAEHGHTDVPKTDADNQKLGRWVSKQRETYKYYKAGNKQKSKGMCEERINKLESIDFKWTVKLTRKKKHGMKCLKN